MHGVQVANVTVTTNGSGAASAVSTPISGEILAIGYLKGTVNAGTTAVITNTNAPSQSIDSYDVNTSAAAVRYVRAAVNGASAGDNKWCPFVVSDTLTITVTGGALSKTFYVLIYYR